MTKIEQVYKEILKKKVVNKRDLSMISKKVLERVDRKCLYWKYINKLIKEGKVDGTPLMSVLLGRSNKRSRPE